MATRTLLCIALLALGPVAGQSAPSPGVPDLETRRELFVDDWLVAELKGSVSRRLHHPVPREKVLVLDRPWEGIYSGYVTVLRDRGVLRMYYRGMPEARHDLDTETTCLAQSVDGIHWSRPQLGLYEVLGTRANNVVLARHRGCHNFAPFIDANPACPPEARYKAVGGTGKPGLIAFRSPDGIRWEEMRPEPILTRGAFDSQNVAFWSETEGCYVCYFRVFRRGVRWIARSTSRDFLHWTEPVDLAMGDAPLQHHYTNQTIPYPRAPHLYLGLPTRFMPGRRALSEAQVQELGTSTAFDFRNDCADILLTSTRGGAGFNRDWLEAFIRPGLDPRNWTSRANYAAHGIVQTSPQELSLYVHHNVGYPTSHLRRYTLRPDGFVSIHASYAGGELVTRPFTFRGDRLALNCATSAAGGLRVALLDGEGHPLEGHALEDCPEIIGDDLDRIVSWRQGADLSAHAGRAVRLRIALKDADLFSLRFIDSETSGP